MYFVDRAWDLCLSHTDLTVHLSSSKVCQDVSGILSQSIESSGVMISVQTLWIESSQRALIVSARSCESPSCAGDLTRVSNATVK